MNKVLPENRCAVVLFGPQGSGKTTLTRALAERTGASVIEAGNLLEAEIRRQSSLGQQIAPFKKAGALVPSELVVQVLGAELARVPGRLVMFDGFPRSMEQNRMLLQLLEQHNLKLCGAVVLKIDLQRALERITGRRICRKCDAIYNIYSGPPKLAGVCERCGGELIQREDDRVDVVQKRFEAFERETLPVIELFRKNNGPLMCEEPAEAAPEQVLECVWRRLEKVLPSTSA